MLVGPGSSLLLDRQVLYLYFHKGVNISASPEAPMQCLRYRAVALRQAFDGQTRANGSIQKRWARVHDARFLATQGGYNPMIERYRAKLDQKAKEEGHAGINELQEAYEDKIAYLRRKATVPSTPSPLGMSSPVAQSPESCVSTNPIPPSPPSPAQAAESADSSLPRSPFSSQGPKPLSAYLDMAKVLELPARELEYVWRLRHAKTGNSLCAVIPAATYAGMAQTARRHPQFILPLPREGQAAEIHFLQWAFPTPNTSTVLFTHLAEYKLRGEYSQPHTTVTHHLDLQGPKGLVLLQGCVTSGRGVTVEDGRWLLMCLQKFYGPGADLASAPRKRLLERFSGGAEDFRLEELLEEAEKVS